jgi:hypothetical protein
MQWRRLRNIIRPALPALSLHVMPQIEMRRATTESK